ncbi:LysE family translocator [Streptomyces sp. NBC_01233]|nr:LysE family translocator [Streptomyces sp. NBC_01233]
MITASALGSFALIVGLLTLTPGLDTALILRTAALGHRSCAWGVVLGIQTGTLAWGVFSSLGITAVLTASHLAYAMLRWAGAVYLVWMGSRILVSTRRRRARVDPAQADAAHKPDSDGSFGSGWRRGALTNLLNPKVGAFYVAVLPQFIPASAPHLTTGTLLAGMHILLGLLWSGVLIAFARALRDSLRRPSRPWRINLIAPRRVRIFGVGPDADQIPPNGSGPAAVFAGSSTPHAHRSPYNPHPPESGHTCSHQDEPGTRHREPPLRRCTEGGWFGWGGGVTTRG